MTREVLVTIKGTQKTPENGEDTTEVVVRGDYFRKNGKHYLLYEQIDEENGSVTKNTVKFSENYMESIKKGQINAAMIFEPGKQHTFTYNTPFGSILMGVDCSSLRIREEDHRITAEASYRLDMNCEPAADCRIRIEITERGTGADQEN